MARAAIMPNDGKRDVNWQGGIRFLTTEEQEISDIYMEKVENRAKWEYLKFYRSITKRLAKGGGKRILLRIFAPKSRPGRKFRAR